jgi:hypothetical protein
VSSLAPNAPWGWFGEKWAVQGGGHWFGGSDECSFRPSDVRLDGTDGEDLGLALEMLLALMLERFGLAWSGHGPIWL